MVGKILVAITSCSRDCLNGTNQVIRDTWVRELARYGVDHKFFIGGGEVPPEFYREPYASALAKLCSYYPAKLTPAETVTVDQLAPDEILLPDAPDGWAFLTAKVQGSRKWALERGYEFIFKIDTDTYLDIRQFIHSDYMSHAYWGSSNLSPEYVFPFPYAGGCNGYCLRRDAFSVAMEGHMVTDDGAMHSEDIWTAKTLRDQNIMLSEWKIQPTHTSNLPRGANNIEWLKTFHTTYMRLHP